MREIHLVLLARHRNRTRAIELCSPVLKYLLTKPRPILKSNDQLPPEERCLGCDSFPIYPVYFGCEDRHICCFSCCFQIQQDLCPKCGMTGDTSTLGLGLFSKCQTRVVGCGCGWTGTVAQYPEHDCLSTSGELLIYSDPDDRARSGEDSGLATRESSKSPFRNRRRSESSTRKEKSSSLNRKLHELRSSGDEYKTLGRAERDRGGGSEDLSSAPDSGKNSPKGFKATFTHSDSSFFGSTSDSEQDRKKPTQRELTRKLSTGRNAKLKKLNDSGGKNKIDPTLTNSIM